MIRPRILATLFVSAGLGLVAPASWGQTGLPTEVVRASVLTGDQAQAVRQYVGDGPAKLAGDDPREVRAARERLLEPLRDAQATLAFRQAYAGLLVPELARLAGGTGEVAAVNALRVLGELATTDALEAAEARLADTRPAIRYSAVTAIERTFNALRSGSAGVSPGRALESVDRLGAALSKEGDGAVFGVVARALATLVAFERPGYDAVRGRALEVMASRARERFPGLDGAGALELLPGMVQMGQAARDALTDPRSPLDEAARRNAAEINGHAFAVVFKAARAGAFKDRPAARDQAAQVAAVAEAAILVAAGRGAQALNLADDLRAGTEAGDRAFAERGLSLLTVLKDAPLSFPADRFIKG